MRLYDSARKVTAHVVGVIIRKAPVAGPIIDVGCGQGLLANHLAAKFGLPVTGVDVDQALVAHARRSDRTGKNTFIQADAADLPFAAGSFALANCTEVLEHVTDSGRVLEEIHRVLIRRGWLVLSVPNEELRPFSETNHSEHKRHFVNHELDLALRKAGFVIVWSGYRYHPVGALIDRVLVRVGPAVMDTRELAEHATAVSIRQPLLKRLLLAVYESLFDPLVERLVVREFTIMRNRPGQSLLVLARSAP